jgi:hypothetical protein
MPFNPPKRCKIRCETNERRCFLYEEHSASHYGNKRIRVLA